MKGIVKFFNEEKGFGFINTEENEDVFFHISKVNITNDQPLRGKKVTFEIENTKRGNNAINITVEKDNAIKFLSLGDVRIKASNVKDYGINNESEMFMKYYNGINNNICDAKSKLSNSQRSLDKMARTIGYGMNSVIMMKLHKNDDIKMVEKFQKQRALLLTSNNFDEKLELAKANQLIYLYVTTYQNDNYKFYQSICEFDIYEKLSQIDAVLA